MDDVLEKHNSSFFLHECNFGDAMQLMVSILRIALIDGYLRKEVSAAILEAIGMESLLA